MSDSNTPMLQVRGLKKYFPIYKGLFRSLKGTVKAVDDYPLTYTPKRLSASWVSQDVVRRLWVAHCVD